MIELNKYKFAGIKSFLKSLGFPSLISYGVTETQNYIVTELLGPTLKDKLKDNEGPFSLETVC